MPREPNYDSPPGIELKLKWRHTWPGEDQHDFCADTDVGKPVGRFYWCNTGSAESVGWWWFSQLPHRGIAKSPREAAKAIEDIWFSANA